MIFKSFTDDNNKKQEPSAFDLDDELEKIFNNKTFPDQRVEGESMKNPNNEDIDINDFIFLSDEDQKDLESKNSTIQVSGSQSNDKFLISPYTEYVSPVSFGNSSLTNISNKDSANMLGRKSYLDSAYKRFNSTTQRSMFKNDSIKSNVYMNTSLSAQTSRRDLSTPPSYSPIDKPLPQYPCFDSEIIAKSEELKRKKRSILTNKLSQFRSSEQKDEKTVKKEGRIHKMISTFTNKQKKISPSNESNKELSKDDLHVSSINDNIDTDNDRTPSETSTLKNRTRTNSQFSLSAGSEKHLMNSMFKMSHIVFPHRTNSGSISSVATNATLYDQQVKPDLDLEISDASLAFKLARTRTKGYERNDSSSPQQQKE